jgi:hypothetical protein
MLERNLSGLAAARDMSRISLLSSFGVLGELGRSAAPEPRGDVIPMNHQNVWNARKVRIALLSAAGALLLAAMPAAADGPQDIEWSIADALPNSLRMG